MSPTTIRFLKVGMAYFILGALLGTCWPCRSRGISFSGRRARSGGWHTRISTWRVLSS